MTSGRSAPTARSAAGGGQGSACSGAGSRLSEHRGRGPGCSVGRSIWLGQRALHLAVAAGGGVVSTPRSDPSTRAGFSVPQAAARAVTCVLPEGRALNPPACLPPAWFRHPDSGLGLPHPALAVPTSSGSCSAGPAGIPFPLSSPLGRRPARPVPTRWPCRAPGHPGGHAVPDALALGPRFSSQPVRPCWPGVWSSDARWLSPGRPAACQLSKDGMASLRRPAGKPRGSLLQRCSPESSLPLRSSRDALPVCVGTWPCVARVPLSAPPGVRPGAGPVWLAPQAGGPVLSMGPRATLLGQGPAAAPVWPEACR